MVPAGWYRDFVAPAAEVSVVPPYVPWPHAAMWVSGVFELVGAAGLLFGTTRRAAGIGLFVLTILVTPVRIYVLQQPDLFDVPYWASVLRLPLQVALIAWSTLRDEPISAVFPNQSTPPPTLP